MDDNDNGPDYYQAAKKSSTQKVKSGGVIINEKVVTEPDIIEGYLKEANEALERAKLTKMVSKAD